MRFFAVKNIASRASAALFSGKPCEFIRILRNVGHTRELFHVLPDLLTALARRQVVREHDRHRHDAQHPVRDLHLQGTRRHDDTVADEARVVVRSQDG